MTTEQINSMTEHLNKQSELFDKFDYVSILFSKEEVEYIVKRLQEHAEPTREEVINWCKARNYKIVDNDLLEDLLRRH